ncbi:hypothetical protein, partial [Christiangramia aquimixticola]
VDNSDQYPNINVLGNKYPDEADKEMAHGYTNHTQIKWNGILGNIVLSSSEKSKPKNLHIYSDISNESLDIQFEQTVDNSDKIKIEIEDSEGNS